MKDKKFWAYFYNPVTYAGVYLATLVFISECFLFAVDMTAHGRNLYLGLITYVFLPPFLLVGLVLIPAGALWERRRIRRGGPIFEFQRIKIDLSKPHDRNMVAVFLGGSTILVLMTLAGLYKGFQYTESVEFCGVLCHEVMNPEYQAYQHSPHSKVDCVACHIGDGADSYLHSKLAGARQLLKKVTNTYKAPIETPVRDLRPAKEICLECHSPGKLFSTFDMDHVYYPAGSEEPWKIRMMLDIGAGGAHSQGVHAHMNFDQDIYYAAEDKKRQKISWVKTVDGDGKETLFVTPGSRWEKTPPPASEIRKMDCIDCHNRPSHKFHAPYRLVDLAMHEGSVDPSIPDIKQQAMDALSAKYATRAEAMSGIEQRLKAYYQKKQPDFYASRAADLEKAIDQIKKIYSANMFPEMKARWDTHPDNIGHLVSPGCFRCHDGEHKSESGRVITQDCKVCHLIVEQGPLGKTEKNLDGLEFKHPTSDEWQGAACTDCHTGA